MTVGVKPSAEITIDPSLVLALLQEQHTDLAHLPLIDIGEEFDSIDDDTWMRARGWALALGLTYLAAFRDDEAMGALGRTTIDAVLNDNS